MQMSVYNEKYERLSDSISVRLMHMLSRKHQSRIVHTCAMRPYAALASVEAAYVVIAMDTAMIR